MSRSVGWQDDQGNAGLYHDSSGELTQPWDKTMKLYCRTCEGKLLLIIFVGRYGGGEKPGQSGQLLHASCRGLG